MERLTKHSKQTSHENGVCCTHFLGPECLEVGGSCIICGFQKRRPEDFCSYGERKEGSDNG